MILPNDPWLVEAPLVGAEVADGFDEALATADRLRASNPGMPMSLRRISDAERRAIEKLAETTNG